VAASVSGTTLIGRIRDLGGYRDPFITDAMLLGWINDSLAQLWDLIIKHDGSRVLSAANVSVVAGTAAYDLASMWIEVGGEVSVVGSDYYRIKGVQVADTASPDGWTVLERYMWPDRHAPSLGADKLDARWDVQQGQLWIWPLPSWSATVRVEYYPTAPQLASADGTFDSVNYWTEWVVFDGLVKCALKGDDDAKGWAVERDRREAMIRSATPQAKGAGPKTMVSIYSRWADSRRRLPR